MKGLRILLATLALGSTAAMAEECAAPAAPAEMPDGATANEEQMITWLTGFKEYQGANLEYMNCLDPQISAAATAASAEDASDATKAKVKELEDAYNAAVSVEEELAGKFNTEIREFKANAAK